MSRVESAGMAHGWSDNRRLADATRAYQKRERELLDRIAVLERENRSLRTQISFRDSRLKREQMPTSCYRDPRTAEALPFAVGHRGKRTEPVLP